MSEEGFQQIATLMRKQADDIRDARTTHMGTDEFVGLLATHLDGVIRTLADFVDKGWVRPR